MVLFPLDHLSAAVFNELEKRSRSIKHVFIVSRIPVGPRVCL